MLMQHYKEPIMEIFALIALTSAGSATLLLDRTSATVDPGEQSSGVGLQMEPAPEIVKQTLRIDEYAESDVELAAGPRCKVYTAWCEAEVLLLNINDLKGGGRPSAPSPIP
jgi:hypothetical protein